MHLARLLLMDYNFVHLVSTYYKAKYQTEEAIVLYHQIEQYSTHRTKFSDVLLLDDISALLTQTP